MKIDKDKLLHFTAGLLLAQFAYISLWFLFFPVLAGIGKELYDMEIKKTKFDTMDMAVTMAGCLPVLLIYLIS